MFPTVVTSELTSIQQEAVDAGKTSFLLGPAGTGKSTAVRQRLLRLLAGGEPAYTILVLVAESEQQQPFLDAIHQSGLGPYADLKITTYNRMAQEMVSLFWPLVARPAGFIRPYQPPTFLSYDLAQLLMWHVITPMLDEGAFADLRLQPQQIVSQILDTLNRASLNSLSLEAAIERQIVTWAGEPDRIRHLQEAARAARSFRRSCLDNSLLDLSLVVEVFDTQLVQHPEFHRYFSERYRHLIVDNVEEQTPAGQNFVRSLMNATQTTAVAYDAGGGYKRFLAADPLGANQFRRLSHYTFEFDEPFVTTPALTHLSNLVENYLMHTQEPAGQAQEAVIRIVSGRYRREMITSLVPVLQALIEEEGVAPDEIAVIAPYLDGALRYMLTQAFKQASLPYYLLRRRSSPRDEPRVRAWLTWLALAHPDWNIHPSAYDVAEALTLSIDGLDPARAEILTERLYQPDGSYLLPISELPERVVARVGMDLVGLVEELRLWLEAHDGQSPIDTFLHDLFNRLLSQRRFQAEPDLAGAAVCDWLVRAASRLRRSAAAMGFQSPAEIGVAFIEGINQGLVTANPPESGDPPDPDGIMISTMYGYLLAGKPVRVQIWLETSGTGWWDIPNQPLSNAFVLAQSYDSNKPWTMDEDFFIRNQVLSRIIRGLTNRCSDGIILANSDLDRRGLRQEGPLWRAI
ncbi:MAG TPA: UvrD-helicase domain-containing protein, partial [Anaerolineae bacterium]